MADVGEPDEFLYKVLVVGEVSRGYGHALAALLDMQGRNQSPIANLCEPGGHWQDQSRSAVRPQDVLEQLQVHHRR